MTSVARRVVRCGSVVLTFCVVAVAAAQQDAVGNPARLEVPDQPPGLVPQARTSPALPRAALTRNGFQSVQVNVNAAGQNIVGDAANETSLAVDPTRPYRFVIGWRQFDTISSNFRQAGWAYSHDAGHTWTFPGVLEPGVFRSDPVLGADLAGNLYYQSLSTPGGNYTIHVYRSTDGGVSWEPGVYGYGGDKNWMAIDQTLGPGSGNIYGCWQRFFNCCDDQTFTRSTDGGASFEFPVHMPSSPTFGTIAVGPDGEVYVGGIEAIDFQNVDQFVVSKSTNAQNSGVTPTFSTTNVNLGGSMSFGAGPNPGGLLGQAQVAVDSSNGPTRGYVYLLCSVDPPGNDPLDVSLSRSVDGGQTWSAPIRINDDAVGTNAWQWFGTIAVAPNGRIDVVWNDTRHDANPANRTFSELYYSYSTDAGVSWSTNAPVSPAFNHFLGYPQQQKLGDYYTMVSDNVGASVAYAATFNGEQDVYYLRIGDDDCNGNGVGDSVDIASGTSTDLNNNGICDECEALGDMNCDGSVNFADINPFVLYQSSFASWQAAFPSCSPRNGDINGDGTYPSFGDINPFVALLSH